MRLCCALLFVVLAFGCTGSDTVPIRGTVTVDGRPAPDGSIRFTPVEGEGSSQAAFLRGGAFETELRLVKYEIRISVPVEQKGSSKVGEAGAGEPTVGELLPAKYNLKTELSLTVTGPKNDVHFDLKTK
ncbi:MAG: hypothetical protein ACRC8S_00075 [Fimbriiglobus sp.]